MNGRGSKRNVGQPKPLEQETPGSLTVALQKGVKDKAVAAYQTLTLYRVANLNLLHV